MLEGIQGDGGMTPELVKVVMRRLNYYHDNPLTPQYPFSMRDLELRARTIIKDIDEQRAKEAAERKESVAA